MAAAVQRGRAADGRLGHDRFRPPFVSTPPRLLDALRRDGALLAAAPRIARVLGERAGATRAALDLTARVLAGGAGRLASSPFGTARLFDEALNGPFDAGQPAFDDVDLGAAPRVAGAAFGAGSDAAVRLFGVEPLARLAGEVSAATGLSTLSAARLSAMVMPVLIAACRHAVLRSGEDAAGLARALIREAATFGAAPHARRVALAAGWIEASAGPAEVGPRDASAGPVALDRAAIDPPA